MVRDPYVYHSDDGMAYQVQEELVLAAVTGEVPYTGSPSLPIYPPIWLPRHIRLFSRQNSESRWLIIGDTNNASWTSPPEFFIFAGVRWMVTGVFGEYRPEYGDAP